MPRVSSDVSGLDKFNEMVNMKREEATKTRKAVLVAVAQMTLQDTSASTASSETIQQNERVPQYSLSSHNLTGVSSSEVTRYLNKKYEPERLVRVREIQDEYEGGKITGKEKERKMKDVREPFSLRTVQRSLEFLITRGLIVRKGGKYSLSDESVENLKSYTGTFGDNVLRSLMNIHEPLYNTTEKNICNLVTLFGTYVFYCLLESSRPFDDKYFLGSGYDPMTVEEKNTFTEKWLKDAIDVSLLYRYFIETFLNQPDDAFLKKLKAAKPTGYYKRNKDSKFEPVFTDSEGKEYRSLKLVKWDEIGYVKENGEPYFADYDSFIEIPKVKSPFFVDSFPPVDLYQIPFEIDERIYEKIKKIFSEKYPKLYNKLIDNPSSVNYGLKNIEALEFYTKSRKR